MLTALIFLGAFGYLQGGYHVVGKGTLSSYRKRKSKGALVTMAYPFRAYLNGRDDGRHPLERIVGDSEAERRYCQRMAFLWPFVLGKGIIAGTVIGAAEAPGCLLDILFEPRHAIRRLRGIPEVPAPDAASLREAEEAAQGTDARFQELESKS